MVRLGPTRAATLDDHCPVHRYGAGSRSAFEIARQRAGMRRGAGPGSESVSAADKDVEGHASPAPPTQSIPHRLDPPHPRLCLIHGAEVGELAKAIA